MHVQSKGGRTRGKQLYMGGYEDEEQAARTWDMAAIKWGLHPLNFPREDYAEHEELIAQLTREELIAHLKRGSSGFSRGKSRFRGSHVSGCEVSPAAPWPRTSGLSRLLDCSYSSPIDQTS